MTMQRSEGEGEGGEWGVGGGMKGQENQNSRKHVLRTLWNHPVTLYGVRHKLDHDRHAYTPRRLLRTLERAARSD